jgi:uncharacterized zinc-type alcohol dehydrogenase-like protein
MEPKYAGPLMCAGVTVFNAIHSSGVSPTGRIAVVGIGGLGHLALQFARAWGCHVTAISHSPNKREEALGFGAHDFLVSKDFSPELISKMKKYDLVIDTVSANLEWDVYLSLLKRNGTFNLIGFPGKPIEIKNVPGFITEQKKLRGSIVGGRHIVELMLEFAERHDIKPMIEEYTYDVKGIEEAIERCAANKARYRAVLIAKD